MIIKKIAENLIFALLILWVAIGVLSVAYNAKKSVSEIKEWGFLSQDVKKQKLFGDYYSLYKFIRDNSGSGDIVLYTTDPMAFLLPRYFLYPQRIYWVTDQNDFLFDLNRTRNRNFFIYDMAINLDGHRIFATFSAESKKRGLLIKK